MILREDAHSHIVITHIIERIYYRRAKACPVLKYPMFDDLRNVNDYASADLFLP